MIVEAIVSFFLLVGSFFLFVGAIGLARLPDFLMRLHAPTKASTLGVGGLLIASLLWFATHGLPGAKELLVTLFMFLTAPVSANLLGKAALHLHLKSRTPLPGRTGDGD